MSDQHPPKGTAYPWDGLLPHRDPGIGPPIDDIRTAAATGDGERFKSLASWAIADVARPARWVVGTQAFTAGANLLTEDLRVLLGAGGIVAGVRTPPGRFGDLHPARLWPAVHAAIHTFTADVRLTPLWPDDGDKVVAQAIGKVLELMAALTSLVDGRQPEERAAVDRLREIGEFGWAFAVAFGVDQATGTRSLGLHYATGLVDHGYLDEAMTVAQRMRTTADDPDVDALIVQIERLQRCQAQDWTGGDVR